MVDKNLSTVSNENNTKRKKFPYNIVRLDPEINSQLLKDFKGEKVGFVQVGPEKWFLPISYEQHAEDFYNMEVRPDDIWIASHPRTGTTMTQEIVWLIMNDFDYETASKIPMFQRFPFLDLNLISSEHGAQLKGVEVKEQLLDSQFQNRLLMTHLPFSLLPPDLLSCGCKVIYTARNPKDVCVSYYHLVRLSNMYGFDKDITTFWNYFERNLTPWAPYLSHVKQGWRKRNSKNLLFLFYEDTNKDLCSVIRKIADFLDRKITESQCKRLEEHLQIDNFRRNASVNYDYLINLKIFKDDEEPFIRKGKVGSWMDEFTPELNQRADKWIEDNLIDTDLRFPFIDGEKEV